MLTIKLINCKPALALKGINPDSPAWQEALTTALTGYVAIDGWDYDPVTDSLSIYPTSGANIPANLTDFGEVLLVDYTIG